MDRLRIYIETSAIGHLDEPTSPKEMADMLMLWEKIKQGDYDVVISSVTLTEITNNQTIGKVNTQLRFLSEISYEMFELNEQAEHIADLVKQSGLLTPDKQENDRLHIGCAVISESDVLVSLNFKHLVNVRTINRVREITIAEGYKNILIMPPVMLIDRGDE